MKWTGLNELRESYLSFFESKGHLRLPSFSLIPQNDKSLLLINSGMAPMKPYFQGTKEPPRRRVTTCQKCIRTPDLENVGKTARHGTYFEMLGNFSFGDYFKTEAIEWSWEFLTKTLEIPEEKLWPSVYEKDDEAYDLWKKYVPEENIITDKQSGKDFNRPGYQALKGPLGLRRGDVLVIKSLDRLSRNKEEMKRELQWFKENGIQLKVLDLPTTMIQLEPGQEWIREMVNNILIEVLSSIAQEERHTIRKRQREGIEAAKHAGVRFGPPEKGFPEEWEFYYFQYRKGELTRKYVLEKLGISVDRFKYLKKKYERTQKGG